MAPSLVIEELLLDRPEQLLYTSFIYDRPKSKADGRFEQMVLVFSRHSKLKKVKILSLRDRLFDV